MAKGLLRLGCIVVMAGVSWMVEACSSSPGTPVEPNTLGETGPGGGACGKSFGARGSDSTTEGGEGGLHNIPGE